MDNTGTGRLPLEQAEQLVDRWGQRAGYLAATAVMRLAKGAALAREAAEDIVAEAQSVRHEWQAQGTPRQDTTEQDTTQ
jgi:hypothetical protein